MRITRFLAVVALSPSVALGQSGGSWESPFWWDGDQVNHENASDIIHLVHVVPQGSETVRAFSVGYGSPRRWRLGSSYPSYGDFAYQTISPYAFHFCMGQCALADGKILLAGGDDGYETSTSLYDPFNATQGWNNPPGYYMLWVLTVPEGFEGVKVPCQRAAYVRVGP